MMQKRLKWKLSAVYPLAGVALSFGAPVGWFVFRFARELLHEPSQILLLARVELDVHASLYAYMLLGTMLILTLSGFLLGIRDDRLRQHFQRLLSQKRLLGIKNRQLSRLSITDRLTGLSNYFRLHEVLELEFKRARRYKVELCVILVDIDYFKKINDAYGHLYGDYVLHELGQLFAASRRETDYVARTGGEEFCFILTQTQVTDAIQFADRLREEVAKHRFEYRGMKREVTLSAGIAAIQDIDQSGPEATGKTLLGLADEALYEAKRLGRNRVVRYHSKKSQIPATA